MKAEEESMSAFPFVVPQADGGMEVVTGMSLRDWFAGQALNGFAVNMKVDSIPELAKRTLSVYAKLSYNIADAMVVESERRN